jgi:hypothetical protein
MRRGRGRHGFHEPSLVPLADMLSNTVGIAVFILIFTVLTTGGVSIPKRLPMEESSELVAVEVVCWKGRVLAVDERALTSEFLAPLGKRTFDGAEAWVTRFRERRLEKPDVIVTGEGETRHEENYFSRSVSFQLVLVVTPRDSSGETETQLVAPQSAFRRMLAGHDRQKEMIYFIVTPGGIPTFTTARNLAAEAGFRSGWAPFTEGEPIRFGISGGGSGVVPVPQ